MARKEFVLSSGETKKVDGDKSPSKNNWYVFGKDGGDETFNLSYGSENRTNVDYLQIDLGDGNDKTVLFSDGYENGDGNFFASEAVIDIWMGEGSDDVYIGETSKNNLNGTIIAGNGNDTVVVDDSSDWIIYGDDPDLLYSSFGLYDDSILGADGDDTIYGGKGADFLDGRRGADSISGGLGADTIEGGHGNDTIDGNAGNDIIYGEEGNDTIDGGADDDIIYGGEGSDVLYGNGGNDFIHAGDRDGESQDIVYTGVGRDIVHVGALETDFFTDGEAVNWDAYANNNLKQLAVSAAGGLVLHTSLSVAAPGSPMPIISSLVYGTATGALTSALDAKKSGTGDTISANSSDSVKVMDFDPRYDMMMYTSETSFDGVTLVGDAWWDVDASGVLQLLVDQNEGNSGGVLAEIHFSEDFLNDWVGNTIELVGASDSGDSLKLSLSSVLAASGLEIEKRSGDYYSDGQQVSDSDLSRELFTGDLKAELGFGTFEEMLDSMGLENSEAYYQIGGARVMTGSVSSGSSYNNVAGSSDADVLFGSQLTTNDHANVAIIYGFEGDDILIGTNTSLPSNTVQGDLLVGGAGSDIMTGNAGADTFAFFADDHQTGDVDTITDFDMNEGDMLSFKSYSATGFSKTEALGDDLALTLRDGGEVILENFYVDHNQDDVSGLVDNHVDWFA